MPGMDGFQVIRRPEDQRQGTAYLPVLVITAQPGHKLRALHAGVRDFISKPFDLVESQDAHTQHAGGAAAVQAPRELQQAAGSRRARSAPPNCVKVKRATAASPSSLRTGTGSRTNRGTSSRYREPVLEMLGIRVDGFVPDANSETGGRLEPCRARRAAGGHRGAAAVPGLRLHPHPPPTGPSRNFRSAGNDERACLPIPWLSRALAWK